MAPINSDDLRTIESRLEEIKNELRQIGDRLCKLWIPGSRVEFYWYKYDQITLRNEKYRAQGIFLGFTPSQVSSQSYPNALVRLENNQILAIDPQISELLFIEN